MFLQNKLQELTSMIEKFIRTVTVDSLSWAYMKQPDKNYDSAQFYLDECLYFSKTGKHKKISRREKEIRKIHYSFFKTIKNNEEYPPVKKELETYGGVSSWVLFDLITFGQLSFFFGKLDTPYKKVVTRVLNDMNSYDERITEKMLSSWINAIRALRNKVSHGMKVYEEPFTVLASVHNGDKDYLSLVAEDRQNHLVNILLAMRRIVMCMSNGKREIWNDDLVEINKHIKNSAYLTTAAIGLTDSWIEYFVI